MSTCYVTRDFMTLDEARARLVEAGFVVEAAEAPGPAVRVRTAGGLNWFHLDEVDCAYDGAGRHRVHGERFGRNDPTEYVDLLDMVSEHEDGDEYSVLMGYDE